MRQNKKYRVLILFVVLFNISFSSYAQQGYESAVAVFEEFCDASTIVREKSKDFSNISDWIDDSFKDIFFSFGGYSMSSRNSAGFVPLVVHDDGKGINISLYDNLVVFSPTHSSTRKLSETLSRNKYSFYTECALDIANYCNEDFVKSFDYEQRTYFEAGTAVFSLSLGQIIAHTINNFVDYDHTKSENSFQVFIREINEKQNVDIEIPDSDISINEFLKTLNKKYTYNVFIDLIFYTYLKKEVHEDTEVALNTFYSRFVPTSDFSAYIDELMSYKLNLGLKKGGVIKFSKDLIEIVDSETKLSIKGLEDYIEIPTHNVNIKFAVDNTPRLIMKFDISVKENPLYKLKKGLDKSVLGTKKITNDKPVYCNVNRVKVVFYNDRIQVFVDTEDYGSYRIINEKRSALISSK